MMDKNDLDTINRTTYAAEGVVRWYWALDVIYRVEEVIFQSLYPVIKDGKLLDIGIGGGRTTKHLLELSKNYIGIDYTQRLAEVVKRKYPEANIYCADARELPLCDEFFDFVLFSLNGIDYMHHEDRLRALREIHRVLLPGGVYVFSSHNRDYNGFKKLPWQEEASFSLGRLKSCLYVLAHWPRHLTMRKYEISTDEYAIVNDTAHGFSLLTYYIRTDDQIKQLERAGFEQIEAYDMAGNRVSTDRSCPWTYYVARKAAAV
jgi:SAM-dependent methyltransferase